MATSSVEHKASVLELSSDLSNGSSSLFHRKIVFHPARRPQKGFSNGGGDFRIETLNPCPSSDPVRTGNGSAQNGFLGRKCDASEVSENGLDPELSFGITFKRIGAGLQNLGNTCYLNSVLQCLTYTEPLAAYLQSGKHKNSCRIAGFCALCAIQKHVSRALQSTGGCLSPNEIVSNLKCISRNFRVFRQEDAHEYMVNLLESMHKCCLPTGVSSESPGAYEKSLVHKIFGGSLRSQVKCLQCSHGSNKYDPFLDLSLEINKADSLDKALSNFTASELLDGGERQYMCQRCKQKVRARKQLTVHKPPYVLTVHLKRFRAHDPGQKIDKKVNFGPTLDLKPFVSDSQGANAKYTLYGVLVHSGGSTRSGHYYCFVRTSSGIWHSLDDNRVSPVSEKSVLEQKAYMLFYVRDRHNVIPRKLSDGPTKENAKANERGMNYSLHNDNVRELVQKGSTDVESKGVALSAVVAQKDLPGVVPPRIPLSNDGLHQPKLEQLMTAQLKVPPEMASLSSKTSGEGLQPVDPLSHNDDPCKLDNGTKPLAAANTNELNDKGSSEKNLSASILVSTNLKEIQMSAAAMDTTVEFLQEIPATREKSPSVGSSKEATGISSEKVNLTNQSGQPSYGQNQVGGTKSGSAKKIDECSQNTVAGKLVALPDWLNVKTCAQAEASDSISQKKLKKKILRSQARMNFGSRFFLRVSMALQKKKKHKKRKSKPLGSKVLTMELLLDSKSLFSDSGPSTSEKTNIVLSKSTHSPSLAKPASGIEANDTDFKDENNSGGGSLKSDLVDGEFKKRIGQNCSVLARDDHLADHHGLSSRNDYKMEKTQNDWMAMLSQGLGDTIVARWDDVELPSENVESRVGESVRIGYIGDEWDEEYDRGKRKKVKQVKYGFDGQNPFQEIASNKAKKAKIDRSRSGNQPFRIY